LITNIGTISNFPSAMIRVYEESEYGYCGTGHIKLIVYALDYHITKFMFCYSSRINERKVKIKVVTVRTTKEYRGSGSTTPLVLNLGNRWG
jgi:hypothetical protein